MTGQRRNNDAVQDGATRTEPVQARHADGDITVKDVVAQQRADFGGIKWGSAFFGWLTATGLAALLTGLLTAAGAATALTQNADPNAASGDDARTVGLAGGIALLVVLMISYYAGGYVASRMARLDGGRQGLAVWVVGLVIALVLAGAGAVFGAKYNVLAGLDLPRIPVSEGDLATAGLIALGALLLGTLLAAFAGGKAGTRYHRRIDGAVYPR